MSGPLAPWLAPVAWSASVVYGLALRARGAMRAGTPPWQAPRPVISVGNVSAGGTGKSPMVRWLCETLAAGGRRPAIVTRGHRGGEDSDEVLEHRAEMPNVPVAVGADRRSAIERLLGRDPTVDVLVLDDGFQHRRVARDLDIVLVDAVRPALDGALLPLGWLREPSAALGRADAVVITRAERGNEALAASVERHHGRAPAAWTRHAWTGLRVHSGSRDSSEAVAWLRGRRVAVWAGIGNREAFVGQLRAAGAETAFVPVLPDHVRYDRPFLRRLASGCLEAGLVDVVCTGKDWVKLRALPLPEGLRFARPELRLEFLNGEADLRAQVTRALGCWDARASR